jgi:hypothetical protein
MFLVSNKIVGLWVIIALAAMGDTAAAQLKKLRTGTTIGELKSITLAKNKRDMVIEVLSPGEERARRYTVGAQQKEVIAVVKAAKVGDRVEVEWFDTVEGLCVDKLKVLRAEKPDA